MQLKQSGSKGDEIKSKTSSDETQHADSTATSSERDSKNSTAGKESSSTIVKDSSRRFSSTASVSSVASSVSATATASATSAVSAFEEPRNLREHCYNFVHSTDQKTQLQSLRFIFGRFHAGKCQLFSSLFLRSQTSCLNTNTQGSLRSPL